MARLTGLPKNVVVMVPRNGAPSAPKTLQATAQQVLKKENKIFDMQDPIIGADLQDLKDASDWNGLLLNARSERGPQWDTSSQMHQVEVGSPAYFDPILLEEPQEPVVEDVRPKAVAQEELVHQEPQPPSAYSQPYPPQGRDPRIASHIQPSMGVPVNESMRMPGGVHPQSLYHGMNGTGPAVGGMAMDPTQQQHQLHQQQIQMRHMSGMGVQQYGASSMGGHMGGPGMHGQPGIQGYPQMQQPTQQQQISIPPATPMSGNGMVGMGVGMNMGMNQGGMPQQYPQQYSQHPQQAVQPGMGMMPQQAQYTQQGGMHGMDTGAMQMHDGVGTGINMYGAQPQQPGGYGMNQPGQQQPGQQMPPAGYQPGSMGTYGSMY